MTVFMNEQDIEFCIKSVNLIKDADATFISRDTSIANGKKIDVYKNQDEKIVMKLTEQDCIKEGSTEHELAIIKENIEKLLYDLKDLGIIKEWFYNGVDGGGYHWKFF